MDLVGYLTQPTVAWFIIGLILLMIEFAVPGLILGFFGAGAWITALICVLFDLSLSGQLLLFIVFSVLSIILLRKKLKERFFNESSDNEDGLADEFVGKHSVALTDISALAGGKIELKGTEWEAKSEVDIKKGENVEIIGRENLVLLVKPLSGKNKIQ